MNQNNSELTPEQIAQASNMPLDEVLALKA